MKFIFFACETRKNAAIRYRVEAFTKLLEADGHQCIICVPASIPLREWLYDARGRLGKLAYLLLVLFRRMAQLRHIFTADAVFFRGPVFPYGPPFFERFISWFNKRMILDLDDAIWEPPAYVSSPFIRFMDFGWTAKMAAMCRHGIVGNQVIRDYVEARNCPATIIPTCIDMALHQHKVYANRNDGVVILGWTGLSDNLGYLDVVLPALRSLSETYDIELVIASNKPYQTEGLRVRNRIWNLNEEIDYLMEADIGLMPLVDTPRARGKCAFKALQYMGVGTPVVLSPVGMNAEVVTDGVTGFLADTPEAWREKLEALIKSPALREQMGRAARQFIAERYSVDAHYPAFKGLMERVGARKDAD